MNLEEIKVRLAELSNADDRLSAELDNVRLEAKHLELEKFTLETGLKIGDIVISGEKEYQVCHIRADYGWVDGYARKKDGTIGVRRQYLYKRWTKKP